MRVGYVGRVAFVCIVGALLFTVMGARPTQAATVLIIGDTPEVVTTYDRLDPSGLFLDFKATIDFGLQADLQPAVPNYAQVLWVNDGTGYVAVRQIGGVHARRVSTQLACNDCRANYNTNRAATVHRRRLQYRTA